MSYHKYLTRRKFLQFAGTGALLLALQPGRLVSGLAGQTRTKANPAFQPDLEVTLRAVVDEVPIFSGGPTRVWRYAVEVHKGDERMVDPLEGTYPGPTIRIRKGQKIRVYFINDISETSIIHWHGLHVDERNDGHPRMVIPQGETYIYEFEVLNRAGTYWFHPHPHGRTGKQVNFGMAGLFLVSDEEEEQAGLPGGEYDVPLVLQDRTFDGNNQIVYLGGGMMDRMMGFLGDQILVNGQPDYKRSVATLPYRLRLLNGSNSRIYKLAWSDGTPMTVIGTDGGLLERPETRPYVMLGPAERVEVWRDFEGLVPGDEVHLQSLRFDAGMMGNMMNGMMRNMMGGGRRIPNGAAFPVMTFHVDRKEPSSLKLPARLSTIDRYSQKEAANAHSPRTFHFFMRMMNWTINGRTFEMEAVADDELVRLNTLEAWDLVNGAPGTGASGGGGGMMGMMGGGMMQMPHPIHIHSLQFQIHDRDASHVPASVWESVREGFVDSGWKDTILLMPGMRARLLMEFKDFTGLYLYHCHNLEHEDGGMMRNFFIAKNV